MGPLGLVEGEALADNLRRIQCQKRPITLSKETYYSVKRDLLQCQKRPITVSKETYYKVRHWLTTYLYIRNTLGTHYKPTWVKELADNLLEITTEAGTH